MGGDLEPTERVTMAFLFTDVVGSTRKWERFPDAMPDVVRRHDELMGEVVDTHGGRVFHWAGDGLIASFPTAAAAADAAVDAQRRLASGDWSSVDGLGVRMGVHEGPVVLRDGEPYGWALNVGARFSDVGGAGQILISEQAVDAIAGERAGVYDTIPLATIRLRDIARAAALYQLQAPDLPGEFPLLKDSGAPSPLPTPPTAFVGRDTDIARLERLGAGNRLLTLVGPPGVGKSRLAVEHVNRSLGRFASGAVRVDVSAATGDLAEVLSTALGVSSRHGRTTLETVLDWLAGREMLLLLDQCDPSPREAGVLAAAVLEAAPEVTVVCTCRSPLGLSGEVVHRVLPLEAADAIALVESRLADTGVAGEGSELSALVDELDGLPLALEVAAASASVYSWSEMRSAIRGPVHARVESPMRPVAAAMGLGFDHLDGDLQDMLTAATVFAGSFDRDAFRTVCAPDLDVPRAAGCLADLVDRSLVTVGAGDDPTRFRLLHSVRDVVELRGSAEVRREAERRLAGWMVGFVDDAAAGLRGPDERVWNRRVVAQFGNLRATFARAVDRGDLGTAGAIATRLWDYGFMRFNAEYFGWADRLVEEFPDGDPSILGPSFGTAALSAWIRDDADRATTLARRALELESTHGLDFDLPARLALLNAAVYSGADAPPFEVYAEAAEYQRGRPEAYFQVNVEAQNSIMATWRGDREAAKRRAIRAVRTARESGNPSTLAYALWALGSALADEDPLHAETHLGQALEIAREAENRWLTALAQMSLASLRRRTGSAIDAAAILVDLLELLLRAGHRTHLWSTLRLGVLVLADLDEDELATGVAAWLRGVGLTMPVLPADGDALDATARRIVDRHGADWVSRVELVSATWTTDTAATLVRDTLARRLDG